VDPECSVVFGSGFYFSVGFVPGSGSCFGSCMNFLKYIKILPFYSRLVSLLGCIFLRNISFFSENFFFTKKEFRFIFKLSNFC